MTSFLFPEAGESRIAHRAGLVDCCPGSTTSLRQDGSACTIRPLNQAWRKQVTLIWLGLGISLLGLALLSIFGLSGSGYSAVSVWGYRIGLLLMFVGLSLCVAVT